MVLLIEAAKAVFILACMVTLLAFVGLVMP